MPVVLIQVAFNANVTSRLRPGSDAFTEALVLIDEPPTANIKAARTTNASVVSPDAFQTGNGSGLTYANGSVTNAFPGFLINANTMGFAVPADPKTGAGRTIRITNVRVNATGPAPGTGGTAAITASLSAFPQVDIQREIIGFERSFQGYPGTPSPSFFSNSSGNPLVVGNARSSFFPFVQFATSAPGTQSYNTNITPTSIPVYGGGNYSEIVFRSNFAGAFAPSPLADFGTRLKAVFNNVPAGVSIFVSNTQGNFAGNGTQLVDPPIAASSRGLSQIPIANGSGTAVWEVLQSNSSGPDAFNFGAWVSYPGSLQPPIPPGTATVTQSYSPTASQDTSANRPRSTLAIPRFVDGATTSSLHHAFLGGQTNLLFPYPDSRTCFTGQPFYYPAGNSCSTGQTPAFSVASQSQAVTPTFSVIPDRGVTLNLQGLDGPLFNVLTPLNGRAFVNATGAGPGSYTPIINVTAPGTSPLQITIPVNVLGASNPVLIPAGFTDAASYQNGIVYPGQVFTAFPANFGPADGVDVAGLDANGKLPNALKGAQVFFDGTPGSMLFNANNQLAGIAPFNLAGKKSTVVNVVWNGQQSPPITLPVGAATISPLSANASGGGPGAIFNQDGTLNTPQNPAGLGSIVTIYFTYGGPLNNAGTDGRTTTSAPYPVPSGTPGVRIGGVNVNSTDIKYFGNVPTGVETFMQANVTVPLSVTPSAYAPVILSAGLATSAPWVTISVKK